MRLLHALLFSIPMCASAQTTHDVHVGGSTAGGALPYYTPQNLTIQVGDIVRWVRDNGTHNVNGSLSIFPANPEGFTSGTPNNTVWPYSRTFSIPGTYNYHCTQQGHSATQFGTVVVINATNVEENTGNEGIELFPVPSSDVLTINLSRNDIDRAEVVGLDGRTAAVQAVNGAARVEIALHGMAAGNYVLRLIGNDGRIATRTFRKE